MPITPSRCGNNSFLVFQVAKKRWTAKKLTHAERKAKVDKAKQDFLSQIEAQRD